MSTTADEILLEAHRLYSREKDKKSSPDWTIQDHLILRTAIIDLSCLHATMTDDYSRIIWTDKGYIV